MYKTLIFLRNRFENRVKKRFALGFFVFLSHMRRARETSYRIFLYRVIVTRILVCTVIYIYTYILYTSCVYIRKRRVLGRGGSKVSQNICIRRTLMNTGGYLMIFAVTDLIGV